MGLNLNILQLFFSEYRLVLTFRIYLGIKGMGSTGPDRKPSKDLNVVGI